ncbi:MAG: hypothetical protein HYZ13_07100 [Acidobacteria bacterium]|nr:hypothetical protein [Acidobacteriota bacterium]
MLEAVQCPKCSTRYGLRRERVKAVHARAQCHRCQGVFPIYDVVARLLELPPKEQPDDATATMGFKVEDLEQLHTLPPALPEMPEEPVFLEAVAELEPLAEPFTAPQSLSADDLLGSDSEILEKTLVTSPEPVPEIRTSAFLPEPLPEERTASGQDEALPNEGRSTGSYRSAKDAISQLFGETPVREAATPRLRKDATNGAFEVEATLEALEHTLGGSETLAKPSVEAAPLSPLEPEFAAPSSATQRMSLAEMQAAIAAVSTPDVPSPQELEASEVTQMMDASRLAKQPDPGATNPVPSFAAESSATSDDPNLLRLRIGEEVYPNLAMDQLIRWVEEGRVIETHFVARQFSENWIEAHKVPGLRPVFERLRRLRAGGPEASPEATAPVKKSLFGGLFGKKDN